MFIQLTEEQLASIQVKDNPMVSGGTRQKITDPKMVFEHLRHIGDLSREHCMLLTLDVRKQLIAKHEISVGIVDCSLVHPREVFRAAILDGASAIIVAHNHPSGDTTPSDEDVAITKRLVMSGKVVGISVVDHVVIGINGYYSMQENGRM